MDLVLIRLLSHSVTSFGMLILQAMSGVLAYQFFKINITIIFYFCNYYYYYYYLYIYIYIFFFFFFFFFFL